MVSKGLSGIFCIALRMTASALSAWPWRV